VDCVSCSLLLVVLNHMWGEYENSRLWELIRNDSTFVLLWTGWKRGVSRVSTVQWLTQTHRLWPLLSHAECNPWLWFWSPGSWIPLLCNQHTNSASSQTAAFITLHSAFYTLWQACGKGVLNPQGNNRRSGHKILYHFHWPNLVSLASLV